MQNEQLKKYYETGFRNIIGFCPDSALFVLDHLDTVEMNRRLGVMEIGIHHGQFFIALNSLVDKFETSCAIDVFEDQHLNIDNSGHGDRVIFEKNLYVYDSHNGKNVRIMQTDSTTMTVDDHTRKYRFISVDGGHTVEHVVNDLKLANELISPTGVVVLDDWFNHWWPSVTEGLVKYLGTYPTLVPFASSNNKMWLCKCSYKPFYKEHMLKIGMNNTSVNFYGHEILDIF